MTGSITEYLIKLQELTQKNLDILQALNDSFFTNQNHLSVKIGSDQYTIPSFISLENKINSLTSNFHNLVNAPEFGEAFFNFDGNSRAIEVRTYNSTPASLVLEPVQNFNVEQNDIFKDFLTPNPYIHINLQTLPNDTTQVMVKKIIPLNSNLKQLFETNLLESSNEQIVSKKSISYSYNDLYKILSLYKQDEDYIEYDTKLDLPIRKNIGTGTYVIEGILEDYIDEDLTNYITLKLRSNLTSPMYMNNLKYRLFDETIERPLKVGDQLVTFEGNAKMEITELRVNSNTIVVKVLNGEFLNLVPADQTSEDKLVDLNKLRFYSPVDFSEDKYVKVPLEEDRFIFIAVAALNQRMNIQSTWGSGLMIDTYSLTMGDNSFQEYYKENVNNIGDILFEITSMMNNTLTKYSEDEYKSFAQYQPEIDLTKLKVMQINDHLNNSTSIQNIRSLYTQKKELQGQISNIQTELNGLHEVLATISFDDTTGRRAAYTSQISSLNAQRNQLSASLTQIMDEIAISANNSEVPIENAKYRIRGYFNTKGLMWEEHIKGIRVQYKYKNVDTDGSNRIRAIDEHFTFSDWNEMTHHDRKPEPQYVKGKFISVLPTHSGLENEISFEQIDIPISQGEVVEMRLKIVYDFGAPFVQTTSQWSPTVTIDFPEEYLKDIKILDIISENNNDIETNRFNNIIKEEGVPEHIGDKVIDQDITYFHKPENIASGFYTAERRIIPLKDKLEDLNNILTQIRDEVYGSNSDSLKITFENGSNVSLIKPYIANQVYTESYDSITSNSQGGSIGNYEIYSVSTPSEENPETQIETQIIFTTFNLTITNDSNHVVKLFSMFPGDRKVSLNNITGRKYTVEDYMKNETVEGAEVNKGVWFEYAVNDETKNFVDKRLQGCNQFLYFRINDVNTGQKYYADESKDAEYESGGKLKEPHTLSWLADGYKVDYTNPPTKNFLYIYPMLDNEFGMCLETNNAGDCIILNPQQSLIIPIAVEFGLPETSEAQISRTITFDVLPSLYKDPINYKITIVAKKSSSTQDLLQARASNSQPTGVTYSPIYQ